MSTGGASMATTASAGAVHSRAVSGPVPSSRTPSSTPASARSCSSVRSSGSRVAVRQPGDRHGAVVVVQRGEQPGECGERVRHGSAIDPAVHGVLQRPHLDDDADPSAQRRGERRDADAPVRRVGEHDHVGREALTVAFEEPAEIRRADLLLALDEHRHADRQVVTEGAQCRQVQGDPGLVVGGAPPVEAAVAQRRGEGVARPRGHVAGRLHVVVGVQQHGRGAQVEPADARPRRADRRRPPAHRRRRDPPRAAGSPRRRRFAVRHLPQPDRQTPTESQRGQPGPGMSRA